MRDQSTWEVVVILDWEKAANLSREAGWTEEHTKAYKGPTPQVVSMLAENVRAKLESTYTICESGTGNVARHDIIKWLASHSPSQF